MKRIALHDAELNAAGVAAEPDEDSAAAGSYTRTAIVLHWIIAALVISMIVLGQVMTEIPRQTPWRGPLFNVHKSLGLLVLGLVIVRLAWRLVYRPPPFPTDLPAWNRDLANLTHGAFYFLLLAQPLLGYFASVFGKYGVAFFSIPLPGWGHDNPAVREPFLAAHHLVADLLVVLIALHLAGVAWHRFGQRPDLWRRMWR